MQASGQCQAGPVTTSAPRVYGGVEADLRVADRRRRLLDAGLQLLGTVGSAGTTVRRVCEGARLTSRYFYESFPDVDTLAAAVFDRVVAELATDTLAAVAGAPPYQAAKTRAGLGAIVRTVAGDPRKGRLLFAESVNGPAIAHRRQQSSRLFAGLLGSQARDFLGLPDSARLALAAHFLVGGLAEVLVGWLDGALAVDEDEVVEICTVLFTAVADRL